MYKSLEAMQRCHDRVTGESIRKCLCINGVRFRQASGLLHKTSDNAIFRQTKSDVDLGEFCAKKLAIYGLRASMLHVGVYKED